MHIQDLSCLYIEEVHLLCIQLIALSKTFWKFGLKI